MANASLPPLPVPRLEQQQVSDCLAACAAMVLAYLDVHVPYPQLLDALQIGPIGAPRRNVIRLERFGVRVAYREATLSILSAYLVEKIPVITFVDSGELPYWSEATNHAVVVIGLDEDTVTVNDPAFATEPQRIPVGDFELAWLNSDNACAIIIR
jgi:ABC-type bacteriocin/lantibiotic exporter with double-glycine peptidase domain